MLTIVFFIKFPNDNINAMNGTADIMTFKEKHIKISDSEIKDLLQNQMKLIDHIKNKQNQDVSGNLLYYCNKITFYFLYPDNGVFFSRR